jgi:nicotinate-nucleotide--dimethylbenzimidazole phosphoribosyltransferase
VALRLAGLQRTRHPAVDRVRICVFAADHGVAAEPVSAFPQSVTAQMVLNMARGGAAISVLARRLGAEIELVNLGTVGPVPPHPGIRSAVIAAATADLSAGPAMQETQLLAALNEGRHATERALAAGAQLFVGGEMGIGNTTAATALACALLRRPPGALVGPGTGLDAVGIERKTRVIERALALHRAEPMEPIAALRCLGGFEIAALTGAYVACSQQRLPILVDGFISSVAALVATHLSPDSSDWMLLSHASAEPGHRRVAEALGQRPLLDLGLRLGEGSGAAAAVPLLRLACQLHNEMATFSEAGVAGVDEGGAAQERGADRAAADDRPPD